MLSDPIKAALITGSIQAISAIVTIFAAWAAFRSWRRTTLGNRQIELAEECLLMLWDLDSAINAARKSLIPLDFDAFKINPTYSVSYGERHNKAFEAIRECNKKLTELKDKFLIAEFYLGEFPSIKFEGQTRFFKMDYPIVSEYDEVLTQLVVCLFDTSPQAVTENLTAKTDRSKIEKSTNLFYGFAYEYEEDEFSIRLKITRRTFERHLKKRLRQTSILTRAEEKITEAAMDRYRAKFKPATINKHPN